MAHQGTPAAIVGSSGSPATGLDDPELRQRLASSGYEPAARNSPTNLRRFIRSDTAKWVALVEKTSMKIH